MAEPLSKTTLSSVKSQKSGQMTVRWKRNTTGKGYEIQYTTDKKFKKNRKTFNIDKNSTTKTTIKSLKKGKTYYVRIRTVQGKKTSGWSAKKSVRILGGSAKKGQSDGKSDNKSEDKSDVVYITETGSKYHRGSCRTLKSKIKTTRSEAIAMGYEPCKVCNPG